MDDGERAERRFRRKVGQALMAALEAVPEIRPMRCTIHDQALSDCTAEDHECTVLDAEPYPTALLTGFVVTVQFNVPKPDPDHDPTEGAAFVAPDQPRATTLGLLALAGEAL
ncbi:hypothetical protein CHO01_25320 [Cellulomonas hominis]|uniref:Uncharacterized protein n=1 Tax=Cellulomonas hominis TaxID=156981 RepID=A0A511FDU1_9CELL|nr:hypothetical protein [Cellulomonas hominis]MBB5472498.1 hypothetical protein [Cellulomonas hominis]NKY05522.1 hypothetical protein [Cellulomonas hominis]GEL47416.1 hypothetical protein CHO01_25320 [Cellulomonas hominis]